MTALWWIRHDLRLRDNLTLRAALEAGPILPVYIFDPYFLTGSSHRGQGFLTNGLRSLDADLR